MKKNEFELVNADSIKVGYKFRIYGAWYKVIKINHLNRHPVQLYEFYFDEFREPLRVPAGWQVRIKRFESENNVRAEP